MKLFSSRVTQAREAVKNVMDYDELVPNIEVYKFGYNLPWEVYDYKGYHGIDKGFLRKWVNPDNWEDEAIILHDPEFNQKGAVGWRTTINGFQVLQVFASQDRPHSRMDMSLLEKVILHEILHFLYRKYGIIDRTHYWDYEKSDFKGAFDEIRDAKPTMIERWLVALRHTIYPRTEVYDMPWTLHHTGGENHTIDGLLNSNKYEDRPVFYNYIIDKEGTLLHFHDKPNRRGQGYDYNIAVIGDYTQEIPTSEVIQTLSNFLKDKNWMTHKELAELSLATPSECPGNLKEYVQM